MAVQTRQLSAYLLVTASLLGYMTLGALGFEYFGPAAGEVEVLHNWVSNRAHCFDCSASTQDYMQTPWTRNIRCQESTDPLSLSPEGASLKLDMIPHCCCSGFV